jgi:FixJ family two-component response regulator
MFGLVHIVDDDPSFRGAMERHLKHAGYQVAVYASAQELLDRLSSDGSPGCILLDVQMPDLDGPALQKNWANSARHCRSYFSQVIPTFLSPCGP